MNQVSCNCIVCAQEFDPKELQSVASTRINVTDYKVCQACIDKSDPAEDYRQVRDVVLSYLNFSKVRGLFSEAQEILDSRKKL